MHPKPLLDRLWGERLSLLFSSLILIFSWSNCSSSFLSCSINSL
jgi:hypothetical protein